MPLYMDLHKASDYDVEPTVEEIKQNHIADLAVQEKYGVRFIQYWLNENDGLVYCLMEAPDKAACAAVHQEAHGFMPCTIIELKGGDYQSFMGEEGRVNEFDIVERPDRTFDHGYRVLLAIYVVESIQIALNSKSISQIFKKFRGREISRPGDQMLIAFNSSDNAIDCAHTILAELKQKTAEVRIGISAGHPVTENDSFFGPAIKLANRLCNIAQNGQIVISTEANQLLSTASQHNMKNTSLNTVSLRDEEFINRLFDSMEIMMDNADFNLETLCQNIGISRAQLYRKIKSLTNASPNHFLNEQRLKKALRLLKQRFGNVAEIAYEVGFSNPSYFSSSFQKRFGLLPSECLGQKQNS